MANAPDVTDEFILEVLDDVGNGHSVQEQLRLIKTMLKDAWDDGYRACDVYAHNELPYVRPANPYK